MGDSAEKDAGTQPWTVGVVAETVTGEVVLKMTTEQADSLRDMLVFLTEDDTPAVLPENIVAVADLGVRENWTPDDFRAALYALATRVIPPEVGQR